MPILRDEDVAAEAQPYYKHIGEQFSSADVVRQLDRSLAGLAKYRALFLTKGINDVVEQFGLNIRESLLAAGVVRNEARTDQKVTNAALLDAMFAGKGARLAAHAALESARFMLHVRAHKIVHDIDKTLHDTRTAGADPDELSRQLKQLVKLFAEEPIRAQLGDAAVACEAEINTSIAALHVARESKTGTRGTPAETEHLDLLDGLAVELCRNIRKTARALARERGEEAIATELDLRELYRSTGRRATDEEEGGGGGPVAS